jgi:ribosomal protein S18 acetylase RimI-like enzyme
MAEIQIVDISGELISEASSFFQDRLKDTFSLTFPSEAINKYRDDFRVESIVQYIRAGDRIYVAAIMQNSIVGIMFGSHINGGVASVIWLAVHPEIQGKGIGRKLMKVTFRKYKAMGAHKLVLYTETDEARDFYENIGMSIEGVHPKHWWGIKHYCLAMEL